MLSTLNSVITGALAMGNFGLEKAIYFQLILLGVFVVATLVGYKLISNVPTLLHTPLMSGMNALSGVTVLGALSASASLFKLGTAGIVLSAIFGSLAIALAMVNVVGGFMVTDRMLGMIAKKKAKGQTVIYAASAVAGAGFLAVICCMDVITKGAGTSARDWVYLAMAIVLSLGVLLGIAKMGKVAYSKIGNRFSAICMLLAIILIIVYGNGTSHIAAVWTLYIGLALGTAAGIVLAKKVKMIQMPQMVALLNGLGGAASAIVGAFAMLGVGTGFDAFSTTTSALALAVGMITPYRQPCRSRQTSQDSSAKTRRLQRTSGYDRRQPLPDACAYRCLCGNCGSFGQRQNCSRYRPESVLRNYDRIAVRHFGILRIHFRDSRRRRGYAHYDFAA